MRQTKIAEKIRNAFTNATPDILESVLSDCKDQKRSVIVMKEKKRVNPWVRRIASVAAVCVLVVGLAAGFNAYKVNHIFTSTISLDVNPSIEIIINQKEKVLEVIPLNDDGRVVVGDMEFKGSNLDITVNALIGSMLREGYISELSNSILVSVKNRDPAKGILLQTKLTEEISALLQTNNIDGAVLSQTILLDDNLLSLAESYGITLGKAQLIQNVRQKNARYTFEMLVPLSINELNLLRESGDIQLDSVTTLGTASDKAYIGEEKAKEIALAHVGLMASDIRKYSIEMEYDDGVMIYEVEFYAGKTEYSYEIDATTGVIIEAKIDLNDDDDDDIPADGTYIGEEKAKEIALTHIGLSASDIRKYSIEMEYDDGVVIYEIEFYAGKTEYSYEINAITGVIIEAKIDFKDDDDDDIPADGTYIGEEKAKEIALTHAGLPASGIRKYSIEMEYDDGVAIYEIEFYAGKTEYSYEIAATTGVIIEAEIDLDDDDDDDIPADGTYIGLEKAKEIALTHAGLSALGIRKYSIEMEYDDGVVIYDIEFYAGKTEYSYEIAATTGVIIEAEIDLDDDDDDDDDD